MKHEKLTRREAIEKLKGVSVWMRKNRPSFVENEKIVRNNIQRACVAGVFGKDAQTAAMKQ